MLIADGHDAGGAHPYDVAMVTLRSVIWLSAVVSASLALGLACAAETVPVAPGEFLAGSSPAERERAYRLDEDAVKGGSWDDKGSGVCRPAARHGRPRQLRHILVGFRLVRDD